MQVRKGVHYIVITSESEAIQSCREKALDCVVANAPRNDGSSLQDLVRLVPIVGGAGVDLQRHVQR